MVKEMNELQFGEIEQVSGGNPVLGWLAGVAGGFAGNYLYESAGGKAGIDAAWGNFKSVVFNQEFADMYGG